MWKVVAEVFGDDGYVLENPNLTYEEAKVRHNELWNTNRYGMVITQKMEPRWTEFFGTRILRWS
tara:strand:- start:47 stop:238 length:192 start_codon:yes stop_codon:yes gene_type:complete